MNCSFCANSSYHCDEEGTKKDPVQSGDDSEELILTSNPTTNDDTAPEGEEVDSIVE